jgi:hypothetical protein
MKKLIIVILCLLCISCRHYSETKRENGFVIEKAYAPPIDGSGSTTTINTNGTVGVGSASIHGDEKYMIVFECEHKVVFSIDSKTLYYSLQKGDSIVIEYRDILNSKNEVQDYDFLTAYKK